MKAKNLVKMWTWSRGRRRLQIAIRIEAFTVFWENFYRPIWNQRKTKTISCKSNRWIKKTKAKEKKRRESEYLPWLWTQSKNYEFHRERERERLKKNAKICERERERVVYVCFVCEFWEVKRNGGFWLNGSLNCEECEPSDWNLEIAVVSNGYIIYQFLCGALLAFFSIYI